MIIHFYLVQIAHTDRPVNTADHLLQIYDANWNQLAWFRVTPALFLYPCARENFRIYPHFREFMFLENRNTLTALFETERQIQELHSAFNLFLRANHAVLEDQPLTKIFTLCIQIAGSDTHIFPDNAELQNGVPQLSPYAQDHAFQSGWQFSTYPDIRTVGHLWINSRYDRGFALNQYLETEYLLYRNVNDELGIFAYNNANENCRIRLMDEITVRQYENCHSHRDLSVLFLYAAWLPAIVRMKGLLRG